MPLGIPIPDIGALSKHFSDKCFDALQENIRIVLEKLASPADLFTFDISGALVDSTKSILSGGLDAFHDDFVQQTAIRAAGSAIEGASALYPDLYENITKSLNTVFNIINFAYLAQNNMILFMMKIVARNIINQIESKESRIDKLIDLLTQLYNIMLTARNGDPIYEEYLAQLRSALTDIISARANVQLVKSTLQSSNIYLSQRYDTAKSQVSSALSKVRPTNTNPLISPFLQGGSASSDGTIGGTVAGVAESVTRPYAQAGAFLLGTAGIPNSKEQFENLIQIPAITGEIINTMRDYSGIVSSINGMLSAFYLGIAGLETAFYNSLSRYAQEHLQRILNDLDSVQRSMNSVLNVRSPNPTKVMTKAFEWTIKLSQTLSLMKILPSAALSKANIAAGEIGMYENTIALLKRLDNITLEGATLFAEDAKENVGLLEQQLLPLLLKANAQMVTLTIQDSVLALNKTLINRMKVTKNRDQEIKTILQAFVDYPLAYETELQKAIDGANSVLRKAGLDRAADLLATGDLSAFFEMNAKTASYVGAALNAMAFLKDCFDTEEERAKHNGIQSELESDMDLLNIQVGFNLDLRFFQNLEECLRVEGLVKMFDIEEYLCGLAESAGLGKAFDALNDVVRF